MTNRCVQCGAELSGEPAARCPHCGADSATVIVRRGDVPKDTDGGVAAMDTVAFGVRRDPTTGGRNTTEDERCDFLGPSQAPDEIGRLGGYRVLRVIGSGGMGVVYEAEDPQLGRRVALKAMLPVLAASAAARQRFVREARAAAAVEHIRIVPIYQVGEDCGIPFLVMPLLKGESLEDRLGREGRLDLDVTLWIGREIAEALAAAHERNLIHRDVKPGNVWLETNDGVKLLDFGLARAMESDVPLTQQGSIVGTPAFMAPEQADGAAIDHRCDLFSLGCILYRMSTGTLPFRGVSPLSTLVAIMSQQPVPPRELAATLPPALNELILNLLEKKPDNRPANARQVIDRLRAMAAPTAGEAKTEVAPPRKETTPHHASAGGGTGRWWPFLLAGIGLALFAAAGAFLAPRWFSGKGDPPPPPAIVEIGIAFGTEKQQWFEDVLPDFAATPEGKSIKVNLVPMGSLEGAKAVIKEDQRIHVWSPASSLYHDIFRRDWKQQHSGKEPILKQQSLAMTPIVFVMWKDRHDAFMNKYKVASFRTMKTAIDEPEGWGDIAGKPEWGRFRFGQTDPEQSNSGLMTLVLTAYDFKNKGNGLTVEDVSRQAIQTHLQAVQLGVAGMPNSTGNLMKDMVAKGPSGYDAVAVYENLAIDYLKAARGRWGDLHVAYPSRTMWSDNPYNILDVPWSTLEQRHAAETFLGFLLSEPAQKKALQHGFRPANINIPIRDNADSPFVQHKASGLSVQVPSICPNPSELVLDTLLDSWRRAK